MVFLLILCYLKICAIKPCVSVIIPVYNQEKLIIRCLNSVLNQSLKNIEIICVDDGSTDNTLAVLNRYAEVDKRIIVIHQQNCRVSCAQNTGLGRATGEYVTFVHSDDWIDSDTLEISFHMAKENNASIVTWGFLEESKNGMYLGPEKEEVYREVDASRHYLMNDASYFTVWTKMYENRMLKASEVKFDVSMGNLGEDNLFNLDLVPFVRCIVLINRGFYHYSHPTTGLCRTATRKDKDIRKKKILEWRERMKNIPGLEKYAQKKIAGFKH